MILNSEKSTIDEVLAKRDEERNLVYLSEVKADAITTVLPIAIVVGAAVLPAAVTITIVAGMGLVASAAIYVSIRDAILKNREPSKTFESGKEPRSGFMDFNKIIGSFKRGNPSDISFDVVVGGDIRGSYKDAVTAARHFVEQEKAGESAMLIEVANDYAGGFSGLVVAKAGEDEFQCSKPRLHLIEVIEAARDECRQSLRI